MGEKCAVKYADEIIVLSRNLQAYFKDTYNRETHYIPNGVKSPIRYSDTYIRNHWGLCKDDYLLYLGRIVPEKGLDDLVDAYKQVQTDKRLVIAGGSSHTDDYFTNLKERAKGDSRILFTGFVEGEALGSLYSNAYLYILPSHLEGMSVSLLEAMSYGNCCLTSNIPENEEVLSDAGVTYRCEDIVALKTEIERLLSDSSLIDVYRNRALSQIKAYEWDHIVAQTLEIYKKAQI
jgi:glycosyltransferase involved in cell wall biosynthesis